MRRLFKLGGLLALIIGGLMLVEGLPTSDTIAAAQNSNSSTSMQNMNMSNTGSSRSRRPRRRRHRRRRGRRG